MSTWVHWDSLLQQTKQCWHSQVPSCLQYKLIECVGNDNIAVVPMHTVKWHGDSPVSSACYTYALALCLFYASPPEGIGRGTEGYWTGENIGGTAETNDCWAWGWQQRSNGNLTVAAIKPYFIHSFFLKCRMPKCYGGLLPPKVTSDVYVSCCCFSLQLPFPVQETNLHLKGQLTESHRVEEVIRNDLEAARVHRNAAEVGMKTAEAEKKRAEQKRLKAYNVMDSLRKQAEDREKHLNILKVCEGAWHADTCDISATVPSIKLCRKNILVSKISFLTLRKNWAVTKMTFRLPKRSYRNPKSMLRNWSRRLWQRETKGYLQISLSGSYNISIYRYVPLCMWLLPIIY